MSKVPQFLVTRCPDLITRVDMVVLSVQSYLESENNKFDDDISPVDVHAYAAKHAKKLTIHF